MAGSRHILALAGGVGGARLAAGLARILPPGALTVAVNTGDDFEHLGLHISPDLDTVMYTLAGRNNPDTGWGIAGESWNFMEALAAMGGATWFRLGDRDLATHVQRTRRLADGATLSAVTAEFCAAFGIAHRITPMSDDPVRTMVDSDAGTLPFQDYFVRRQCAPAVSGFTFQGAEPARMAPALSEALADPALGAIIICPSNPFVSIAPFLAVPEIHQALAARRAPLVAVSPIIGGAAVKGPAAKMMAELGVEVSAAGIARHYGNLLDGIVIDSTDKDLADAIAAAGGPAVRAAQTLMRTDEDRAALAETVLGFARDLGTRR